MDTIKTPTTSPTPTKVNETSSIRAMAFTEAIGELLNGNKIHRIEWADKGFYGKLVNEQLVLHKPNDMSYSWIISRGDMEGRDYIVV